MRCLLLILLPLWPTLGQAQAEPSVPQRGGEPVVEQLSTTDDGVRIDELRVRGQTRKITVQPRLKGFGAYDIVPIDPSQPPEKDAKAGQRVWWSLNF